MQALVRQLELNNRTHFLGFRNDVPSLIKSSDIVIIPSEWEGFGIVAVEAMAAGKPVIASDVKGLNEVIDDAGILFPKGNQKLLEKNIVKLLSTSKIYDELVKKGKVRSEKFDIQVMTMKYLKLYRNNL